MAEQLAETDALLNKYVGILSKTEDIAKLIFDEDWYGADAVRPLHVQRAKGFKLGCFYCRTRRSWKNSAGNKQGKRPRLLVSANSLPKEKQSAARERRENSSSVRRGRGWRLRNVTEPPLGVE